MEPSNLEPESLSEAQIEAALRALPAEPLADAGFSTAVLARLPRQKGAWTAWAFPAAGAAVGAVFALKDQVSWYDVASAIDEATAMLFNPYLLLAAGIIVLAMAFVAGVEDTV